MSEAAFCVLFVLSISVLLVVPGALERITCRSRSYLCVRHSTRHSQDFDRSVPFSRVQTR